MSLDRNTLNTGPLVSVIVPVLDSEGELADCLGALSRQDADFAYEVIVVDNGSARPPVDLVRAHPPARLIEEPKRGSHGARQTGVEASRGRFLAFTDADCRPDPGWLRKGAARLERDERCGIVGGAIELTVGDERRPTMAERYELATAFRQQEYIERWSFAVTANLLIRREVLDEAGGFDRSLASGGDLDLGRRVAEAGYEAAYEPEAVVFHPARATLAEIRKKTRRVIGGLHQMRRKGAYSLRDLARDLLYDWPLPGDVGKLIRGMDEPGAGPRLQLLAMLAYVKTLRLTHMASLDLRERLAGGERG